MAERCLKWCGVVPFGTEMCRSIVQCNTHDKNALGGLQIQNTNQCGIAEQVPRFDSRNLQSVLPGKLTNRAAVHLRTGAKMVGCIVNEMWLASKGVAYRSKGAFQLGLQISLDTTSVHLLPRPKFTPICTQFWEVPQKQADLGLFPFADFCRSSIGLSLSTAADRAVNRRHGTRNHTPSPLSSAKHIDGTIV